MSKKIYLSFIVLLFFSNLIIAQCNISGMAITSILIDPNSTMNNFDTDGDGTAEDSDEFVEICNTSGAVVDMSGWTLDDNSGAGPDFTFPAGTVVAAGDCVVYVVGWDPGTPPTNVFSGGNGGGWLNNGGDNLYLSDGTSTCEVSYGSTACTGAAGTCDDWGSDSDGCALLAGGADCAYVPAALIAPQPVDLISFDANPMSENAIELLWATASEEDNDYFMIEHSTNGRDFESVEKVEGQGTSLNRNDYSYMHKGLANGLHYYRLVQVDMDGTTTTGETKTVELGSQKGMTVYPTLASNQLTVNSKLPFDRNARFEIYNNFGQRVMENKLPEDATAFEIDLTSLTNGKYFIKLYNNNHRSFITQSFVKF